MSFKNTFCFFLLVLLLASCQKEEIPPTPEVLPEADFNFVDSLHKPIVLGKKLDNPYSVENMTRAWKSLTRTNTYQLYSQEPVEETFTLEPTHRYIRFIPTSEDELAILETDTTLVLYDHPLDYEIEETGDYYRDPEIAEDQPTYQYASVPVDQEITVPVMYEVLEELFIPDEIEDEPQNDDTGLNRLPQVMRNNTPLVDALVDEALRITGNLEENENDGIRVPGFFSRRSKWRPAGKIQVWDDVLGKYIPIQGVKVRARRWFTTRTGITNSNGYYSCDGRFRRKAKYIIKWKRHDFSIWWSWLSTAKYRGPRRKGDWNLNIRGGTQEFYATIFRAAHHYYYENIKGLKRPPQNYSWHFKMKISAKYETNNDINGSHCKDCRWFGIFARIKIYNPQNSSSSIYATTIHELAHASHWELRRGRWSNTSDKVKESWARGVEWELTRMKYPSSKYKGRTWNTNSKDYTLVVADMIDGASTYSTRINEGFRDSRDRVSGYTIKQIEDVLGKTSSWNGWKDNIKNRYNNATEENLEQLFKGYE